MSYTGIQSPLPANVGTQFRGKKNPISPPQPSAVSSESEIRSSDASPRTVLHFEKSDEESHILGRIAGLVRGLEIRRARTIQDAFKSLLSVRPNQIVINFATCRRDGFQLLEDLREVRQLDDIPIVVLSDRSDDATIRLAFALGATRYFLKPLSLEEYKKCISVMLSPTLISVDYEKFPPSQAIGSLKPNRSLKPFNACSMITEKQALKRYPWVYRST